MEMEMHMDSSTLSLYLPPPSSPVQDGAFPYYHYYPPNPVEAVDGLHIPAAAAAPPHAAVVDMPEPDKNPAAATPASRRRRSGSSRDKVERHSKICTAGGMRDRRMRLSMDVARRFFALQDKLGFDKASKTVEWLLRMSKAGINDLAAAATSMSEDGSVLLQNYNDLQTMADSSDRNKQQIRSSLKRKNINESSSSTSKESRARARQRARERTRERNCLRWSSVPAAVVNQAQAPPPPPAAAGACSYNVDEQQQDQPWELSGVVFARAHRFHSTR